MYIGTFQVEPYILSHKISYYIKSPKIHASRVKIYTDNLKYPYSNE